MNAKTMVSESTVATIHGASYLQRLCRHFSHKVPTTVTDTQGRIEFPFGACRIDVDAEHLFLRIEAENAAEVSRAEEVIATHLIRMANRDEPIVAWQRQHGDPS